MVQMLRRRRNCDDRGSRDVLTVSLCARIGKRERSSSTSVGRRDMAVESEVVPVDVKTAREGRTSWC